LSSDIEAKAGDEFTVKIDKFPMVRQGYFLSRIYVDGRYADGRIKCASIRELSGEAKENKRLYEGFCTTRSDGKEVITAFRFGNMQTTGESFPGETMSERLPY